MADSICTEEEAQKRRRRRWTNQEKLALVRVVKRRVASGESQYGVCKDLNVDPKQYRSWSNDSNNLAKKRPKAKSTCDGMKSILAPVHDELLKFVFELREQGRSWQVLYKLTKSHTSFVSTHHYVSMDRTHVLICMTTEMGPNTVPIRACRTD